MCSFVKNLRYVMSLLNALYNKYFGMNTSFRVSLMYLLLIIPQHGNSPLPVVESWLKKDQDDGFVQRDMTSSLTGGDESFGSAHQTYQNSLIRKKKADNFVPGNPLPATNYRNLALNYNKNQQQYEPNAFYKARYINKDFSAPSIENGRSNIMYESFGNSKLPYSKYLADTLDLKSSMEEPRDPNFLDLSNNKRSFLKGNLKFLNSRYNLPSDNEGNLNPVEDFGRSAKWSMCKRLKARYASNPFINLPQPVGGRESLNFDENMALQNDYLPVEDEQSSRQIGSREYKDSNRPDGKSSHIFDENEYYDTEASPINSDGDLSIEEDDYNQILNEHAFMHKRDDSRQLQNYPKLPTSEVAQVVVDALKTPDSSRAFMSDPSPLETVQEDLGSTRKAGVKTRDTSGDVNHMGDPELVWKLTSDFQTKELNRLMKNSQKALQEVQQFQQKLSYKSMDGNDNEGLKRPTRDGSSKNEKEKINYDEKRLKREDEDEQKNMKTGTDEGGGGEYEDEEGKGHKDEEEYYEDADLSNDESGTEMQKTSELNQKYVKRETAEAVRSKNSKEKHSNNDQDYELNLENAPVENSEKSKKASYREREKTKKSSVRKGVKIWDQWGKWSPCSVTCGVGRSTRWRHCIGGGCAQGEKEAQIKKCTNPAC